MITLKNKKPSLLTTFNKYLEEEKKREEEESIKFSQSPEYLKYLVMRYGGMYCHPTEEDDYDDFDMGYGKSKKAWKRTKRFLEDSFGHSSKKHNKRGKRGGSNKKKKYKELFDDDSMGMSYDSSLEDKTIYYYRDFNNPDDVEIFFNLHDFDQFLEEEGIDVSADEVTNLMTRDISHCCINPDIKSTGGTVQLITDSSYGGLYWSCASEDSFSNDY